MDLISEMSKFRPGIRYHTVYLPTQTFRSILHTGVHDRLQPVGYQALELHTPCGNLNVRTDNTLNDGDNFYLLDDSKENCYSYLDYVMERAVFES